MYHAMNDGGRGAPLLHHAAFPAASPSSSSSRLSCPCAPFLPLPSLFSSPYSLSFFLSASLLWLSFILSLTATFVPDFIRLAFNGGPVAVWIGAWRICQQWGTAVDCSSLPISQLQVLGDSAPFDAFRAFLLLSSLAAFTAALLATIRLVAQHARRLPLPRSLDVLLLALASSAAASQLLSFALFLDAYRSFARLAYGGPQASAKSYGASFVCLVTAFAVQCVGLIAHALTWHRYANRPSGPGWRGGGGAGGAPQALPLQAVPLDPQPPAAPQAFKLPAPSSYAGGAGYYAGAAGGYAPPAPAVYGQGAGGEGEGGVGGYLQAPTPLPAAYLQPSYGGYGVAGGGEAGASGSVLAPTVVHYGQGPS